MAGLISNIIIKNLKCYEESIDLALKTLLITYKAFDANIIFDFCEAHSTSYTLKNCTGQATSQKTHSYQLSFKISSISAAAIHPGTNFKMPLTSQLFVRWSWNLANSL